MIAVEVRRTTLTSHDRSDGLACNTAHTHHGNTHIIAVGRGRRGEGGEEEEEEEKHADIKSNNPHLTGGEQKKRPYNY